MSEREDGDDRDALAAEYALGCLGLEDMRNAESRLAEDPDFAQAVAAWQRRLTPLASLVGNMEPPADLPGRIEASITPVVTNVVPLRRVRYWQASMAGALAIAASLFAFIVLRPPEPARIALLAPIAGGTPVLLATFESGGRLTVRPNGAIDIPNDRDLELWALAKGDTRPRSLGVLPVSGRRLTAPLGPDTQLLVSLEPRGGSPTGQPTGPVLYSGTLTAAD